MKATKWYDWLQYAALLLMTVAVPNSWRLALLATPLIGAATVLKMAAQRHIGNPALSTPLRVALLAPVAYWLLLALSLLWSGDVATGHVLLRLKAVLLILPACFLLSDTSYLTPRHMRGFGYALLLGCVAAFLYFLANAGIEMHKAEEFNFKTFQDSFYNREHDIVYHHAYIALYTVVAMAFVYHELSSHWREVGVYPRVRPVWWRIVLIVCLLLIVAHTVIVNSRAGMVAMGLTAAACVVHLLLQSRNWKLALVVGLLAAAAIFAATKLVPGYVDRLAKTVENVEDDARTKINRSNFHAVMERPWLGYGAGDYHACQVEQYGDDGFEAGVSAGYNAHNQYMESLLSTGIPGLLVILFFLLSPLCLALFPGHRFSFFILLTTAVVMLNLLFESMLERQMGLLFIGPLYALMVLIMSVEENKFGQVRKS